MTISLARPGNETGISVLFTPNPTGRSWIHPGRPETPTLSIAPAGDIGAGGITPRGSSPAVLSTRPNRRRQFQPEHPPHPSATASARTLTARNKGDFTNICQYGDFPLPTDLPGEIIKYSARNKTLKIKTSLAKAQARE